MATFPRSGGYILGFRLDPEEKLDALLQETSKFLQLFSSSPIYGVDFSVETPTSTSAPDIVAPKVEEDVDIVEDEADNHVAAYYLDSGADGDLENANGASNLGFDQRLGLATENMSNGMSLESLWRVI